MTPFISYRTYNKKGFRAHFFVTNTSFTEHQTFVMAKYDKGTQKKVAKVMREYKKGTLKSGGSKKKVKNRKQAIAIGLSEARRAGAKVPSPPKKGRSGRKKK
jgi:hypothetical protein